MFGLFDKRKKELQRHHDKEAIDYLDDYIAWMAGSGVKDNWESFRLCFEKTFHPQDWHAVASDYDNFMYEVFGLNTGGRAETIWVQGVCETYDSAPKDTEAAIFFRFVGWVIRHS